MDSLTNDLIEYFRPFYEHELLPKTDLFENAILDSMGIIEFIAFIEEAYAVVIEVDEVTEENFCSVKRIASLIESKLP